MPEVSVAIPVRDGGERFAGVLEALARQTVPHELIVCDSGSRDGSRQLARELGARVIEIPSSDFSHGGTRNRLMQAAAGSRVALLTQDAEPAGDRWLESLLQGFELARDIAIVYGPYRPRPEASTPVRLELERWFASLSEEGAPTVERLDERERTGPAVELLGRRGFFTDANACIAREAWERVPFREVAYAEDRLLALDMLRAGHAKAFVPAAAVLHSHEYTSAEQLRRGFDEWRGLLELYGWREPLSPGAQIKRLRGELSAARVQLQAEGVDGLGLATALAGVTRHHLLRSAGALLGSRADRLPAGARRRLSLEARGGYTPLDLDGHRTSAQEEPFTR